MHLILILVIGLIVLGPGKAGDLGGQLGRGIREFKQSMSDGERLALNPGGQFCSQCGASSESRARFCPQCGAKVAGSV